MIDWMAGPAMPETVMNGMPIQKIGPVGAKAKMAVPTTAQAMPMTMTLASPRVRTSRPDSPAWTAKEQTPNEVMQAEISPMPQW